MLYFELMKTAVPVGLLLGVACLQAAQPGHGKHIVLIAADQEYRSEESIPALANILQTRHGFRCTVLFALDPDGTINPDNNASVPGIEALDHADAVPAVARGTGAL